MALRVGRAARFGVGVNLVEERRVVREVEETCKGIERTRAAIESVVIELGTKLAAEFQSMVTVHVADHVAKLDCFFRKDTRSRLGPGSTKANATAITK